MDITPYVESLRRDLQTAAQAGGPELQQAAERLGYALDPATRLALMEAISQAAAEITTELPAGSVEVRLDGRELDFVVTGAPPAPPAAAGPPPPPPPPPGPEDDANLARITLRIPESLKSKAEERSAEAGQSLNTWLVSVIRAATSDRAIHVDVDLSSLTALEGFDPFNHGKRGQRRMSGWV